ncbi:MAG: hypothetical protein IJZ68_09205 [Bacteroidaceae bacterium]|nr:hypothetical protein [Bacteroidaceae bacterium]
MRIHAIFKVDRPIRPTKMSIMGHAEAEFRLAGIVSFGKVKNYYCAVDVEKPDHVSVHIETEGDAGFVSALLHEKMFQSIHKFFDLMVEGERVNVRYIAGMYIEFGHFMLNVPDESLVLPNVLEAYMDIVMDFNYDLLDAEMDQIMYDAKALRIGDDPKTAVVIPIFDGSFDIKKRYGWTYTVSTYDTKTHKINPRVYQMVMAALDRLEDMAPNQKIFCIENPKHPFQNPNMKERFDVSGITLQYTRDGIPKTIELKGVLV